MKNAVCRVQGTEGEVDRSQCGAAVPRKRQPPEERGGYLVQDGNFLSLEKMTKSTDTGGTGLSKEHRYGRMMAALARKQTLQCFVECVREGFLVEENTYMTRILL